MAVPSTRVACGVALAVAIARIASAEPSRPFWAGYARDAQHSALSTVASAPLTRVRWQTPVDRKPPYRGDALPIHYGSPVVTQANTVIVPVKTHTGGQFALEAFDGADGRLLWRQSSSYLLPPHDWVLPFGPALGPTGTLWIPGPAGTLYVRTKLDEPRRPRKRQVIFYGVDDYRLDPRTYRQTVFIDTPLTIGTDGAVYFGFQVTGFTPNGLRSGIARVADDGTGTWVAAADAAGNAGITKVAHNCAPALSPDGAILYVAVTNGDGSGDGAGFLVALDSRTLATVAARRLDDPASGAVARVHDDGTASPTVGPDGDVYFGVLEQPANSHHGRGWLLHFDAGLAPKGVPGGFGWDDTASIVPAVAVPSYAGNAPYLLFVKSNDYVEAGGDGVNRIALLDPSDRMLDPVTGIDVMREVLAVAGPTPDDDVAALWPHAVREWCINTAAVDPIRRSILVNSEDGKLYRWDLATGRLAESIALTTGRGEAYTPTLIGPDGTVYAVNDATLFAVGP